MRILTWNCRRGKLAEKREAMEAFSADLLVLTEASRPEAADRDTLWFGEGKYGVAIVARQPYTIRSLSTGSVPCVYPVTVSGPEDFTMIGVWTWSAPTYKQALLNGLTACAGLPKPWVVAGDFNGNVAFDKPRARSTWRSCFDQLERHGLVSAYHAFTGAKHGSEPHPTHYFRTHADKPFHLDYCYIPGAWSSRIESVVVPSFDDFAALSDHRPVVVSLDHRVNSASADAGPAAVRQAP